MKLVMLRAALFTLLLSVAALAQDTKPVGLDLLAGDLTKFWATKGNWSIDKDGVLILTPRPTDKGWTRWEDYLWSKKMYGDFEIEFEYQIKPGGNSGFYFRVGDKDEPVTKGFQIQIADSAAKATITDPNVKLSDHDAGGLIPGVPPKKITAKPAGEWNKMLITSKGDKVTVKLNDEVVNELEIGKGDLTGRPKMGYIGFQDKSVPVSIRNLRQRDGK